MRVIFLFFFLVKFLLFDFLEFLLYCLDVVGWVQVYGQTKPLEIFKDDCSIRSCNIVLDDSNFMNFDQVANLPEYRMKFDWDGKTLEWTQKSNPLDPAFWDHEGQVSLIFFALISKIAQEFIDSVFKMLSIFHSQKNFKNFISDKQQ